MIGSNVFNLAALIGLAAVVAGWIGFRRRVVVLSGVPRLCLLTVAALVAPAEGAGAGGRGAGAVRGGPGMRRAARLERLTLATGGVR